MPGAWRCAQRTGRDGTARDRSGAGARRCTRDADGHGRGGGAGPRAPAGLYLVGNKDQGGPASSGSARSLRAGLPTSPPPPARLGSTRSLGAGIPSGPARSRLRSLRGGGGGASARPRPRACARRALTSGPARRRRQLGDARPGEGGAAPIPTRPRARPRAPPRRSPPASTRRRRHGELAGAARGVRREAQRGRALAQLQRPVHARARGERALHPRGLAVRGARPPHVGQRAGPGGGVRGEDAEPQPEGVQTLRPERPEEEEHAGCQEVLRWRRGAAGRCWSPEVLQQIYLGHFVLVSSWSVLPWERRAAWAGLWRCRRRTYSEAARSLS